MSVIQLAAILKAGSEQLNFKLIHTVLEVLVVILA